MRQSLPGIKAISFVPCNLLSPHIIEKHRAGIPIGVFQIPTPIEHYGNASCEAESEYTNGMYYEKTVLQFTTTDEIPQTPELAFVVTDVHDKSFLIGCKEVPHPIVEISKKLGEESNIFEAKVTFSAKKSLIPCVI